MIGGQLLDLEAEGRHISLDALRAVHRRKTGALIAAACVIGGLAAGGVSPGEHLAALRAYGEAIGLAFQIADDVLDVTATSGPAREDGGAGCRARQIDVRVGVGRGRRAGRGGTAGGAGRRPAASRGVQFPLHS